MKKAEIIKRVEEAGIMSRSMISILKANNKAAMIENIKGVIVELESLAQTTKKNINSVLDNWTAISRQRKSVLRHNYKEAAICNLKAHAAELKEIIN